MKNMGVQSFEKNETATMFFLKKPSLVIPVLFPVPDYTALRWVLSLLIW